MKNWSKNRWLLMAGFFILILWAGSKVWRISQAASQLVAYQDEIELLMEGSLIQVDPDKVETILKGVRHELLTIQAETAVFLPFSPYLGWLPGKLGPTAAAAPALLEMANAGTESALFLLRGLKPGIQMLQSGTAATSPGLPEFIQVLDQAKPDLIQAESSLENIVSARKKIPDPDLLPWRIQTLIDKLDTWLPLGQAGLKIAPLLPELMGINGPRRYLIIAQNEDEIRPTGGFITGAGLVSVENGRILSLQFKDANAVDNWTEKPYDFPPQPLYDFMGLELFGFRDANFWPDFPTSAQKAMDLYSYGQDSPPLDGAIAIDQKFLQLLIEATGPIPLPESEIVVTSNNILAQLHTAWAIQEGQTVSQWVQNRKAFLSVFAGAFQAQIESNLDAVNPVLLARNLYLAAQGGDLQIYVTNSELSLLFQELGWDGRLPTEVQGDFLMVVDSNLGYSKANYYVDRTVEYLVSIESDGTAIADLAAIYKHSGPAGSTECRQDFSYYADAPDYLDGAEKCFWDYLRLYVPSGSELLSASRHEISGETLISGRSWSGTAVTLSEQPGLTTFANFFVVPQAGDQTVHFRYRLPGILIPDKETNMYQLTLSNQAGLRSDSHKITITLPPGSDLLKAEPEPNQINGLQLHFAFDLIQDTVISVTFQ